MYIVDGVDKIISNKTKFIIESKVISFNQ